MNVSDLPSIEDLAILIYDQAYKHRTNYKRDPKSVCLKILQQAVKHEDHSKIITDEMINSLQRYLSKPVKLEQVATIFKDELRRFVQTSSHHTNNNDPYKDDWPQFP